MKCHLVILTSLVCAVSAHAEDPAKPADAPAPKPVATYQLKTKSSFNVPEGTRAPFTPIGWVKQAGPAIVVQKANIDEGAFRLTSILLGNPSLVVINGRSYEEGQFLRLPRGSAPLRIRVYRIADGQVWLQYEDKIFAVPLKRPELNERKGEQPALLSEDRDFDPIIMPTPPAPVVPKATPTPR